MRLDKYLKVSRIVKRRIFANEICDAGRAEVNGRAARASYDVKVGDIIALNLGGSVKRYEVLAVNEFAPKDAASAMYRELS